MKKSINASQAQSQALFPRFGGLGLVSSVAAAAILAACGGGGTDPAAPVTPPPVSNVQPSTIVTSVPTATYAAGSEELAAFNLLNAERQRCGFGLLAQNTKLDQSSRAHASWLIANNFDGHIEDSNVPNFFTGVTPDDRANAAGYVPIIPAGAGGVTENLITQASPFAFTKAGFGASSVRSLLSAPYHSLGMTRGMRDGGVALVMNTEVAWPSPRLAVVYNSGTLTDKQEPATGEVLTYPCAGTTDVNFQLRNETPNPVPGRDLLAQPLGHPITIRVRGGDFLAITSVTMVNSVTGASVALRPIINATNDPNGPGFFTLSDAYTIPDAPLAPNTSYRVTVDGTVNGAPFAQKSFTFTTGTGG